VSCDRTAPGAFLIDVSTGGVTTGMVLSASISTGATEIWNVAGANWQVQTSERYAMRIWKILGGRIIPGPWQKVHPEYIPEGRACLYYNSIASSVQAALADAQAGAGSISPTDEQALMHQNLSHQSYLVYKADQNSTFSNDFANAGLKLIILGGWAQTYHKAVIHHGASHLAAKYLAQAAQAAVTAVNNLQTDCSSY
jgi:hypothetical protein